MKLDRSLVVVAVILGLASQAGVVLGQAPKYAEPLALVAPASAAPADGDDDDDDAPRPPVLNAGLADLDGSPPVLLLGGRRICETPIVRAGASDGSMRELVVFNSGPRFVQAGLEETAPGTYRVALICPAGRARLDVTIGDVGPEGPPGAGFPGGQSCPEGTFAIGFDLDGALRCGARPAPDGACPCFADATVAAVESAIARFLQANPDSATLSCNAINDFSDVLLRNLMSGDDVAIADLFGRDDTCGLLRDFPGETHVETYLSPLSPAEAEACRAAIVGVGQRLGCFEP